MKADLLLAPCFLKRSLIGVDWNSFLFSGLELTVLRDSRGEGPCIGWTPDGDDHPDGPRGGQRRPGPPVQPPALHRRHTPGRQQRGGPRYQARQDTGSGPGLPQVWIGERLGYNLFFGPGIKPKRRLFEWVRPEGIFTNAHCKITGTSLYWKIQRFGSALVSVKIQIWIQMSQSMRVRTRIPARRALTVKLSFKLKKARQDTGSGPGLTQVWIKQ